jgi:hypothetical protein
LQDKPAAADTANLDEHEMEPEIAVHGQILCSTSCWFTPAPAKTVADLAVVVPEVADGLDSQGNAEDRAEDEEVRTAINSSQLFCIYPHAPLVNPNTEFNVATALFDNTPNPLLGAPQDRWFSLLSHLLAQLAPSIFHPFSSFTAFVLVEWFTQCNRLLPMLLNNLVSNVLLDKYMNLANLAKFNADTEIQQLDGAKVFFSNNSWKSSSVCIPVPTQVHCISKKEVEVFKVPGIWHCHIVNVIIIFFTTAAIHSYHLTLFKEFFQLLHHMAECVWSELYNSNTFYNKHIKLCRAATDTYKTVIAAIMLWSDLTHLANFGTASLWLIYLFLGKISKYVRGRPTSHLLHHLAYLPLASTHIIFCDLKSHSNTYI